LFSLNAAMAALDPRDGIPCCGTLIRKPVRVKKNAETSPDRIGRKEWSGDRPGESSDSGVALSRGGISVLAGNSIRNGA
jgi:hypothetical protein